MSSDWEPFALGELLETIIDYRGKTPPKSPKGIPTLTAANVKDGRIDMFRVSYVSQVTYDRWTTRGFPKPGDILITTEAPVGEVAPFPGDQTYLITRRVMALRGKKGILNNDFLLYALLSQTYKNKLLEKARGSTVPRVLKTDITGLEIALPSICEQKSIANVLKTIDDKIELNRQINQTLEQIAQAVFKSWFVDFEPVKAKIEAKQNGQDPERAAMRAISGKTDEQLDQLTPEQTQQLTATAVLFPDELTDSDLGPIPEEWDVLNIGGIGVVIDCLHSKKPKQVQEDTGRILLQLNNIGEDGLLYLGDNKYFISEEDYQKWISRIEVRDGDCVITNVGRVGAVASIPESANAAIGRNMTAVRLKKEYPYPAFLMTLMSSKFMKGEIEYHTDVGTILNALNVKSIPKLRFSFGGIKTLNEFEKIVQPILRKRQKQLSENASLSTIRNALLPKLLSGELTINDAQRTA